LFEFGIDQSEANSWRTLSLYENAIDDIIRSHQRCPKYDLTPGTLPGCYLKSICDSIIPLVTVSADLGGIEWTSETAASLRFVMAVEAKNGEIRWVGI
jgi:hypothetical protein